MRKSDSRGVEVVGVIIAVVSLAVVAGVGYAVYAMLFRDNALDSTPTQISTTPPPEITGPAADPNKSSVAPEEPTPLPRPDAQ